MKYCSINGVINTKSIAIDDRGLAYGDGLFTTAKIASGKVVMLDAHVERLRSGCNKLGIDIKHFTNLKASLESVAYQYDLAVLKVMITAGSGGRGYSRQGLQTKASNLIIMVFDFPQHYHELAKSGMTLDVSQQQVSVSPMLSGIKHLNRLEQVLLRKELDASNADDLVVSNALGQVVETTCANLFYYKEQQLFTPDVTHSGVNGLMRQRVLSQVNEATVKSVTLADLLSADEIFICNCIMGIMPIKSLKGRVFTTQYSEKLQRLLSDK